MSQTTDICRRMKEDQNSISKPKVFFPVHVFGGDSWMDAELTGIMRMSLINLVAVVGQSDAFGLQGKGVAVVHVSQVDPCDTSHTAENALNEWAHLPWCSYDTTLCSMRLSRSDPEFTTDTISHTHRWVGHLSWSSRITKDRPYIAIEYNVVLGKIPEEEVLKLYS